MAYRSRVVFSERSRPLIFCWVLEGRRSRSAWLEVGGMAVPVRNRSTSASRWRRHSSSVRAGGCLLLAPGTRPTSDSPTVTPRRNSFRCSAVICPGTTSRPWSRATLAAVDEAAQRVCDLAGPDRLRVALGGVLKIPEQVLAAQLVADAGERIVVLVPVVHDDRAVQVGIDEALEGGQVPVAQEVAGQQARAGD